MSAAELRQLVHILNPNKIEGRLILITRCVARLPMEPLWREAASKTRRWRSRGQRI